MCWWRARPCSRAAGGTIIAPTSPRSAMPRRSRAEKRRNGRSHRRDLARRRTSPGDRGQRGIPPRRQPIPRPHHGRRLVLLQGGGRPLSPLRRARLPVGTPHADLSLAQEANDAITVSYAIPGLKQQGWTFENDPAFPDCTPDTVNGFHYLHQAYTAGDPHYTGKVTVPTLWDKKARRIVNNESSEIIRMLNSEFDGIVGDGADFYPKPLRGEIDRLNETIYANVNNGVYRCGFAKSQSAYEAAYDALFATLDELDARLSRQRYLFGRTITEADWRLFPTLVRFDVAYFSLFRCNKQRIADFPNLSRYMKQLYRTPGIAATVKARYYVLNYWSNQKFNPSGIIPKGTPVDFTAPHDRARLAG